MTMTEPRDMYQRQSERLYLRFPCIQIAGTWTATGAPLTFVHEPFSGKEPLPTNCTRLWEQHGVSGCFLHDRPSPFPVTSIGLVDGLAAQTTQLKLHLLILSKLNRIPLYTECCFAISRRGKGHREVLKSVAEKFFASPVYP